MSEAQFRQAYDVLMERMPDPPGYDEITTAEPRRRSPIDLVPRWMAVASVAVMSVAALSAIVFVGSSLDSGDVASPGEDLSTPPSVGEGPPVHEFGTPVFSQELPWTLVFDNGYDSVQAIDLNDGIPYRTVIPGGSPGDQPYRLTLVDGRLVVGWGGIYSYDLTTGTTDHLAQSTIYVPAAEQDRVWMVDYGGRIGSNPPDVWQVSASGEALTEKKRIEIDGFPSHGVPGGLAVSTDGGIQLWDLETAEVIQTLGDARGIVGDVRSDGLIAWCESPCTSVNLTEVMGNQTGFSHPTGRAQFDPDGLRFSNDWRFVAAPAPGELVVYDMASRAVDVIPLFEDEENYFLEWAPSGPFLFASTYSYGERAMSIAYVNVLTGESEVVDLPFGGTLDFVVIPTEQAQTLLGFECPVTVPTPSGFIPSELYPTHFPNDEQVFYWNTGNDHWYGTDRLWTVLPLDPRQYIGRQSVWWSLDLPSPAAEIEPDIDVFWRRLDRDAPVARATGAGSGGIPSTGSFMMAGIDPQEPGCWQVTATYKGATLSYVYDNRD